MPTTQPPLVLPRDSRDSALPIPPPPLLTRSVNGGNMTYENHPSTPTGTKSHHDFVTPQQTPQGSPSKNHPPPGAYDLPSSFDNAMRLFPTATQAAPPSPTKVLPPSRLPQLSPTKAGFGTYESATAGAQQQQTPGSPTRNKENTPPTAIPRSPKKEQATFLTQAAQSRAEPYRTRDAGELAPPRPAYVQRGLSAEDLEKLAKPSVKRLANVTQLCE
jgi:cell cycle protein kinase DBF2